MKTLKTFGDVCFVLLSVVGVLVCVAFLYYHFMVHEITIGVNNISDQVGVDIVNAEDLSETEIDEYEERWFMEANYYSNDNNNGIELQELRFNYFTTYNLLSTNYRSTGMQYLGDYKHKDVTVSSTSELNNYVFPAFNYYDTTDGISYSGYSGKFASVSTILKRSTSFTIKIDNRAFEIQLNKSYSTGWWIFGTTHYWTYSELFESVFDAIKSNSRGYGDYYITVDLSDYFSIYEYDTETGKFKQDDVTDVIKNYAVLKFHYDENGARNSSQSLFGSIDMNSKYDTTATEVDTTYWQERMLYTLTDKDLSLRYSENHEGYFASLSQQTKTLFENMPRAKVNIVIETEYNDKTIVGIDYNGFENFEIDTLTITGDVDKFYLLEKSMYGTNLQKFQYSNNIIFDYDGKTVDLVFDSTDFVQEVAE